MKNCFVLLGGNMLGEGAVDKLHGFGYDVIVVDWNDKPALTGDLHIQHDVKDASGVVAKLKSANITVCGAMSFIDLAAPTVNAINKWCGNSYMPEEFNVVLSKEKMKQCWKDAGIFNRLSEIDDNLSIDDICDLSRRMKIIVKPNIAASSRGITILPMGQPREAIQSAEEKAKSFSYDKKCLIEEFVEGREFTVDMLGDSYGNVSVYGISVKYHSPYAVNNRVATKLHWNSNSYPDSIYKKIAERGKACYRAIGLKSSFGHLEMVMKEDGSFSPIEIGARSSGFISSHLVSAAAERDYLGDYIEMLHGSAIDSHDHICGKQSAMWYGYDLPTNCKLISAGYLTDYLPPSVKVMYSNHAGLIVGHRFGSVIDDNTRDHNGYEMLCGPKDVLTLSNILKAECEFITHNIELD